MNNETLTIKEASENYGRCEEQIRRLIRNGKLNVIKRPRKEGYLVYKEELDKYFYGRKPNVTTITKHDSIIRNPKAAVALIDEQIKQLEERKAQLQKQQFIIFMKRDDQSTLKRNYIPRRRGA